MSGYTYHPKTKKADLFAILAERDEELAKLRKEVEKAVAAKEAAERLATEKTRTIEGLLTNERNFRKELTQAKAIAEEHKKLNEGFVETIDKLQAEQNDLKAVIKTQEGAAESWRKQFMEANQSHSQTILELNTATKSEAEQEDRLKNCKNRTADLEEKLYKAKQSLDRIPNILKWLFGAN